jgi:thiosulfate/3-mercaptopyruvate sulfurtransferase
MVPVFLPAPLVSTRWLAERVKEVTVLDASWYLPGTDRNPKSEYAAVHIPSAVFFDIDAVCDHRTALPHMLPPPEEFSAATGALGINDGKPVVVYDGAGIFSAPRVWWMLRAMGHEEVAVLNGGLPKWQREGRPLEAGTVTPLPARHIARPVPALVRSIDDMRENLETKAAQVLDARGAPRFTASAPEPRPGVRGGHIPGSRNVHYARLLTEEGTYKTAAELRSLFVGEHIDLTAPIVTSCGTGVTAAVLLLGLVLAGARDVALYDGSWTEWGSRSDTPVETGP